MTATCGDDKEMRDRRTESRMENQNHGVSCINCHQLGLQSSVLPPNGLHDTLEPSTKIKIINDLHIFCIKHFYLVLNCMSCVNVFFQVTIVIKSHSTNITHNVFGLQMNFMDMLT